jgi:hypothetical protein
MLRWIVNTRLMTRCVMTGSFVRWILVMRRWTVSGYLMMHIVMMGWGVRV